MELAGLGSGQGAVGGYERFCWVVEGGRWARSLNIGLTICYLYRELFTEWLFTLALRILRHHGLNIVNLIRI